MSDKLISAEKSSAAVDLYDLEIETFEVESLSDLGIIAAAEEMSEITVASTSSTTSSSCG